MEKKYEKLLESITDIFDNPLDKVSDENIISICNYILDGNLFVRPKHVPNGFTYEKRLKYDIENFNWDIIYPSFPNLCQLYLQGFATIKFLVHGYLINSKNEYLDLASKLIKSWLEYEPHSKSEFTWYDHSVSDRVLVMIYFILTVKKNNISKFNVLINEMDNSIKKHADFLYSDENYIVQNHGTMMDRSLYIASVYLTDKDSTIKYRKKSLERMKNAISRDFSDEMVNVENSSQYHLFDSDLFITIEKSLLNRFGDSLENLDQSSIEKCLDFMIYLSKPDLNFPMIGDGSKWGLHSLEKLSFYPHIKGYPPLEWLLTSGKRGYEPKGLSKIYKKEGYAFFRNKWSPKNDITYVSFKAGYSVKYHKHGDDLSFTLFTKGKDIFVDAGTYTYEPGDFRRFFMYSTAHNTVVVDDKNYPFILGDSNNTGIIDHGKKKDYWYIIGKNDMYDGVNLTRSLYYLQNGDMIIIDNIQSYYTHNYSQYYHLGYKVIVKDIDVKFKDNNTLVKITDDDICINISQLGHCDVKFINGDKNEPRPGIVSEGFGHLEETTSIKFSLNSKNARFITLITVNDINKKNDKQFYIKSIPQSELKEELIINESGKEIKIPLLDYSRKIYKDQKDVVLEQNDSNIFTFKIIDPDDGETFAWYIFKDGKKFDTIWYTSNPVLKYLFTEPGEYQIQYFIKKGDNKKMMTFPNKIIITPTDIGKSKINYRIDGKNE